MLVFYFVDWEGTSWSYDGGEKSRCNLCVLQAHCHMFFMMQVQECSSNNHRLAAQRRCVLPVPSWPVTVFNEAGTKQLCCCAPSVLAPSCSFLLFPALIRCDNTELEAPAPRAASNVFLDNVAVECSWSLLFISSIFKLHSASEKVPFSHVKYHFVGMKLNFVASASPVVFCVVVSAANTAVSRDES